MLQIQPQTRLFQSSLPDLLAAERFISNAVRNNNKIVADLHTY